MGERSIAVFVASMCAVCTSCEDGQAETLALASRNTALVATPGLGVEPGPTMQWQGDEEEDAGVPAEQPPSREVPVVRPTAPTPSPTPPTTSTTTTTTTTTSTSTMTVTTTRVIMREGPRTTITTTTTIETNATSTTTTTTTVTPGNGAEQAPIAAFQGREFRCKLVNGAHNDDPTPNALHTRFNMRGTDLGVPLVVGPDLYLFFGDTMGYQTIWPIGEADAVARIPLSDVRADVTALCRGLDVLVTPDDPSVAHEDDPEVLRDFAGAFIIPPEGDPLSQYIHLPPLNLPNIPGALEVPSGALRSQNDIYVFYASGATFTPTPRQTLSFVSRWDDRTRPGYQVLHMLDALEGGALGGHFIQVAPLAEGDTTYLFGTGVFRQSPIYLARTSNVEDPEATELYLPHERRWAPASTLSAAARISAPPVTEPYGGVGELSAFKLEALGLYGLIYQREARTPEGFLYYNRILARFARKPEGPWSEPVMIADMLEPEFRAQHCCGVTCQDDEILHCERAGLYAAYALPAWSYSEGVLRLPFLVSTWDPYNVVLFEAHIALR